MISQKEAIAKLPALGKWPFSQGREFCGLPREYGFKRVGRCFSHDNCPYVIDFVNPPITVGHEAVREFQTLKTSSGMLQLLSPTDCVKDRLASYFHWNDQQAVEQARLVAESHQIDVKNLKQWAKLEGFSEKLDQFLKSITLRK